MTDSTENNHSSHTPYLDPNQLYADELDNWSDLWDDDLSLFQNIYDIASQTVVLPHHPIQMKLAATYLLVPSKWAKCLPILFSWGDKGTGKSTFGILASKLHGFNQVFSATDTFASLRNALDAMRWIDPDEKQLERDGAILAWDNIHAETLMRDPKIYQMLLSGYSRSSDKIIIAGSDGFNREYHVFSPKVISSVQPIHMRHQFDELKRRLLVIRHKQFESFTQEEKNGLDSDFNIATDRLDLDSIHWGGIEEKFHSFWNDEANCRQYVQFRKSLTKRGKKAFKLPDTITGERYTVLIDIVVTGLMTGAWGNFSEAFQVISEYYDWILNQSDAFASNTKKLIKSELIGKLFPPSYMEAREKMLAAGLPVEPRSIPVKSLKDFLEIKRQEGALDILLRPDVVQEVMWECGFVLNGMYWTEKE